MAHQGEQLKAAVDNYKPKGKPSKVKGFAEAMGISRQWAYNYFDQPILEKEIREKAAKVLSVDENVLFTQNETGGTEGGGKIGKEASATHSEATSGVLPSLYEKLVLEVIENSQALRKLSESNIRISDSLIKTNEALLEERPLVREAVKAAIDISAQAGNFQSIAASLEKIESKMELQVAHDDRTHLFFAEHIAALEGRPVKALTEELYNAMLSGPTGSNKHKKIASGTGHKA